MKFTIFLILLMNSAESRPFYKAPFRSVYNSIKQFGNDVKQTAEKGASIVSNSVINGYDTVRNATVDVGLIVSKSVKDTAKYVTGTLRKTTSEVDNSLKKAVDGVIDVTGSGLSYISTSVQNGKSVVADVENFVSKSSKNVASHITKGVSTVTSEVGNGFHQTRIGLLDAANISVSFASSVIQNGLGGIQHASSNVGNFLGRTTQQAGDAIDQAAKRVVKAAPDIKKGLVQAGETIFETAKLASETVRTVVKNSVGLNRSVLQNVTDWLSKFTEPLLIGLGVVLGIVAVAFLFHYGRRICFPCKLGQRHRNLSRSSRRCSY
ncbi:unnamed protein product [Orchesella dallaii]|uniref:Uncharacterized protein n=1 Tax=Orchesella dallaii TaxID=48710 RepID=A0ABP1RB54_9HEXA